MPFESEAQRRFMYAKHPEIAKKWAHEGKGYVKGKKRKRSKGNYSMEAIHYAMNK